MLDGFFAIRHLDCEIVFAGNQITLHSHVNRECGHQFSATAGMIFNDSHLSLPTWFMAVALMVNAKKGLSAKQMERDLDVSYPTAWHLCHGIRKAMKEVYRFADRHFRGRRDIRRRKVRAASKTRSLRGRCGAARRVRCESVARMRLESFRRACAFLASQEERTRHLPVLASLVTTHCSIRYSARFNLKKPKPAD